ncbi:MAG: type IX secretion system membrane protein PorP/SprF [Bacteroidota bacterium]
MRTYGVILIFVVASCDLIAQQDPINALYLNNPIAINPAYAGANDMLNAGIQYRTQWTGIESNPTTFNFNSNMSVLNNKGGNWPHGFAGSHRRLEEYRCQYDVCLQDKIQMGNNVVR